MVPSTLACLPSVCDGANRLQPLAAQSERLQQPSNELLNAHTIAAAGCSTAPLTFHGIQLTAHLDMRLQPASREAVWCEQIKKSNTLPVCVQSQLQTSTF